MDYILYLADLTPSDYVLLTNLKSRKYLNESEMIAVEQHFIDQTSEFLLDGLKNMQNVVPSVLNSRVNIWNNNMYISWL